ncbi:hypothetical protein P692DRAFT_20905800 [Suillus brevipes Sb2]|nr:hypothetical protein P692DRAFT_20905800 [Suillus brevipes Sb2]
MVDSRLRGAHSLTHISSSHSYTHKEAAQSPRPHLCLVMWGIPLSIHSIHRPNEHRP